MRFKFAKDSGAVWGHNRVWWHFLVYMTFTPKTEACLYVIAQILSEQDSVLQGHNYEEHYYFERSVKRIASR